MKIPLMIVALCLSMPLHAGKADVVDVKVRCPSSCTFNVTVQHADTGWEHYANQWDVLAPDGQLLGTRVLYHPHVNEQPFTRSLSNVKVPQGIDHVIIRAQDSKHGWGGVEQKVELPQRP